MHLLATRPEADSTEEMPSFYQDHTWPSADHDVNPTANWFANEMLPNPCPRYDRGLHIDPSKDQGAPLAATPDTPSVNMINRLEPHLGADDSRAPSPSREAITGASHVISRGPGRRSSTTRRIALGPVDLGLLSLAEGRSLLHQ